MQLHATNSPMQNSHVNRFILSIDKRHIIETFENKSVRSQMKDTL